MTSMPPPMHNARKPSIDTTQPAMNSEPIELDSTPIETTSPTLKSTSQQPQSQTSQPKSVSPDEDERAYESVSGIKGVNAREREKRTELLDKRAQDPAVLVDIPQTPDAVDYEVARGLSAPLGVGQARPGVGGSAQP